MSGLSSPIVYMTQVVGKRSINLSQPTITNFPNFVKTIHDISIMCCRDESISKVCNIADQPLSTCEIKVI